MSSQLPSRKPVPFSVDSSESWASQAEAVATLDLTVLASSAEAEERWVVQLQKALEAYSGLRIESFAGLGGRPDTLGSIVFVEGSGAALDKILSGIPRGQRAIFLLADEAVQGVPEALSAGKVDDILVFPFRPLEVLGKIRHYQQMLLLDEVARLNTSFQDSLAQLQENLGLAARLQKGLLPTRFPAVKGFQVTSRYLAGLKSGGDYFDLAESREGNQVSILLSDSSSYGLSSAVLASMMRIAVRLSSSESRSSRETVRLIHGDLGLAMKESDRLSLFYGVISRKDYKLRYLNLGSSCAFLAPKGGKFQQLSPQGEALGRLSRIPAECGESEVALNPEDRFALISDGYIEAAGGIENVLTILDQFRQAEAKDVLNELVYRVKSRFSEPEDMPAQDCTAIVFDVDSRLIRLT